jgi:hypothetical protein
VSNCNSCSRKDRVLNFNANQGKHWLVNTAGDTYQSSLVTNSLTHGTSRILSFGNNFAADEPIENNRLKRKKLFEADTSLSLAFIIKIEYNMTNVNTKVFCNSAYNVATQDRSYHPSPNNFGGICGMFCATKQINQLQAERSFQFFKGLDQAPCLNFPNPGQLLGTRTGTSSFTEGAKISNANLGSGPYGNALITSVMLDDFPSAIPARYSYEIELIGRALHTYYGNCWVGDDSPFASITRRVDSAGAIFDGSPLPACVALCAGDLSVFNANYNDANWLRKLYIQYGSRSKF